MTCLNCGRGLTGTEKEFCPHCGTKIAPQQYPYNAGGVSQAQQQYPYNAGGAPQTQHPYNAGGAPQAQQQHPYNAGGAPYTQPPYPYGAGGAPTSDGKAIASLILGIFGLFAWFLPIIGAPVTIVGLVLGINSMKGPKRALAIAGVVLCIIGLLATMVNGALGAYLAVRDLL